MRELAYSIMDVFAERVLEGNALAVFHDGGGLTEDTMQMLAREMNLAETVFVIPGDVDEELKKGVRVRIFTTQEELPFAGHPTLGTASWLYFNHPLLAGAKEITLLENVGPITVTFEQPGEREVGVRATMRQNDPVFGNVHNRKEVARAIGLSEKDLLPGYEPQTVSTGMPFCIVPLKSEATAQKLQISQKDAQAWLDKSDAKFFYCVAPLRGGDAQWHARMQFYSGEDPATGSAAGCCIAWLVKVGLAAPGREVVIEQGIQIQRPSRITVQASLVDDKRRKGRKKQVGREAGEKGKRVPRDTASLKTEAIEALKQSTGKRVGSVLVTGRTIPVARGAFQLERRSEIFTGL